MGASARLVEREDVLAALLPLLDEAAAGRGRLVFLGGEAGIGKTSLATAVVEAAAGTLTVRRGGCDNIATAAALGPVAEAVPELSDLIDSDAGVNRLRLFRRVRAVLSSSPTLVLLEDVHWADEATLELLRFLGRRLDDIPLLILVTFRADEVGSDHPLAVVRGDLATSAAVSQVRLGPLSVAGVRRLVETAGSALDPDEVHRNTGGNPFYVTELLATGEQRLPASVRDAVLARAARLSAPARQVLAAAAVLGPRAELDLLLAVSGQPAAAVDECVELGMLVGDRWGWSFRHELARLAVDETLSPGARRALHATALAALRETGGADDRRLAHHGAGASDAAAVLEHGPRAAARAARLGAHREAAEQYRLVLRFADRTGTDCARLQDALSYECYLTDQLEEAFDARAAALALWNEAGDQRAVGTTERWLSRLSWFLARNEDGDRYGAAAVATLEPLGPSPELAMAYSNWAQLRMLAGDVAPALEWGERALALARQVDDRETEIHALNNVGTALAYDLDPTEGRHQLARSLDLALAADAHEHVARAYTNLAAVGVANRRFAEAEVDLRAGLAYCTERDLDSWRLYMTAWQARLFADQGRTADAQQCVDDMLRQPRLSAVSRMQALTVAGVLAARRGQDPGPGLDEALERAEATGESQRVVPVALGRAEVAWLAGRTDDIGTEIDRAWALAVAHPRRWELAELSWWLDLAGQPRPSPLPLPPPFALFRDGDFPGAAAAWEDLGSPLWAARSLSAAPALDLARRGFELVDAMGTPALRDALARDRNARGWPVPRGPRPSSRANVHGLTTREVEVLALIAQGLTNAEIAQRLFLSEKTVSHHVSAVLRKVDEPTRARAVASALRQGIVQPT
jgi:DNA-binding CsgD family transcriptional regulator/tetratricopeptide (TPR) repeat protein